MKKKKKQYTYQKTFLLNVLFDFELVVVIVQRVKLN